MKLIRNQVLTVGKGVHMPNQMPDSKMAIVLVDDSSDLRFLISERLEKLEFEVIEASNGEEALALIKAMKKKPYMLISDFEMPKMNGEKLFEQLEVGQHVFSHYILMTGLDKQNDLIQNFFSKRKGSEIHLFEKPFPINALVNFVLELTFINSSVSPQNTEQSN